MKDLKTEINSNPNGLKAKIYDTYVKKFIEKLERETIKVSVNNFKSDIDYGDCKITVADVFNPTPELSGDVTEFEYKKISFNDFKDFFKRYDGYSFVIVPKKIRVLDEVMDKALLYQDNYTIPNKVLYKFYKGFTATLSSLFKMQEGIETISINGKKHKISEDYTFEIGTDYYIS